MLFTAYAIVSFSFFFRYLAVALLHIWFTVFGRVLNLLVTCSNWNEVMEVHVVFSLNVTGSFEDYIIRVVSSVGYRLYG